MSKLYVFYDGEADRVIAESPEEAKRITMEEYGIEEDEAHSTWIQEPDDKTLSIRFEDDVELFNLIDSDIDDSWEDDGVNWKKVTKTNREWIDIIGKGILCSSEW